MGSHLSKRERNAARELVPNRMIESFLFAYMRERDMPGWRAISVMIGKKFCLGGLKITGVDLDLYVQRLVSESRVTPRFLVWWEARGLGDRDGARAATAVATPPPEEPTKVFAPPSVVAQLRQSESDLDFLRRTVAEQRDRISKLERETHESIRNKAFVEVAQIHLAEVTFRRIQDRADERAGRASGPNGGET